MPKLKVDNHFIDVEVGIPPYKMKIYYGLQNHNLPEPFDMMTQWQIAFTTMLLFELPFLVNTEVLF